MSKFSKRKVGEIHSHMQSPRLFSIKGLFRFIVFVGCVFFVLYFGKYLVSAAKSTVKGITNGAVNIVSETLGKEMKRDQLGNVNVLLIGYGGKKHSGGFLADSIMVASWNPNLGTVTLISLPRDLYIHLKIDKRSITGRINEVFAVAYRRNDNDVDKAGKVFGEKLKEILGLDIGYYALVDFDGFEKVIDTIGGVDVFVEKDLYDPAYPNGKGSYTTFYITGGQHTLDGATALKYARSRHSTSDFDRAARQQQIIKAMMDKLMNQGTLKSVGKVQDLYKNYTEMVDTNIVVDEILGMLRYAKDIKKIFQFVLTTHYSERDWKRSTAGGFLYTPSMEAFGGMSVILPNGASSTKVSFYDYIKSFVFYVVHNQEYLLEGARIGVYNGIDPKYAKKVARKNMEGTATKMAVKLKKYAFDVQEVENIKGYASGTIVYVKNEGDYKETIETLKSFVNISEVVALGESGFADTGVDIKLIIGNQYVDENVGKTFDYDLP